LRLFIVLLFSLHFLRKPKKERGKMKKTRLVFLLVALITLLLVNVGPVSADMFVPLVFKNIGLCEPVIEPFRSVYKPLAESPKALLVEVNLVDNRLAGMPAEGETLRQGSLLVAIVYPIGNDYNLELRSTPRWECGFGKPCSPNVETFNLHNGDIVEWVEMRCVNFDNCALCTGGFKIIRVSDAYVYRNGTINKARVF
jgi:hypothetical protein